MTQTPIRARPGPVSEAVVHDPPRGSRRERFEQLFTANHDAVLAVRIRLHRARKRFAKLLTAPLANRSLIAMTGEVSHEDA